MNKSALEIIVGMIVLLLAVGSAIIAYREGGLFIVNDDGYIVKAEFEKIDGINVGSLVKISGINIGKVVGQSLNNNNYYASVKIKINKDIKLPIDTSAEIVGLGFMGEKYISLVPGADNKYLSNGGSIEFTQSSLSLESLIGKFMFSDNAKKTPDAQHDTQIINNNSDNKLKNDNYNSNETELINMLG